MSEVTVDYKHKEARDLIIGISSLSSSLDLEQRLNKIRENELRAYRATFSDLLDGDVANLCELDRHGYGLDWTCLDATGPCEYPALIIAMPDNECRTVCAAHAALFNLSWDDEGKVPHGQRAGLVKEIEKWHELEKRQVDFLAAPF